MRQYKCIHNSFSHPYCRDRNAPKHAGDHGLKIVYLSQQQLKSFNLPYQLGYRYSIASISM